MSQIQKIMKVPEEIKKRGDEKREEEINNIDENDENEDEDSNSDDGFEMDLE